MRYVYFGDCKTAEDVKKTYRRLAMMYHPDNAVTGNAEIFKAMSGEYEKAFEDLKNVHANEHGEKYQKATQETAEVFKDIIDRIIFCEGCTIEIIGSWIWVSGNTYTYKELLKSVGFRWSKNKTAWYWHDGEYHKYSRKKYSLQEIRNKYGVQDIDAQAAPKLA